MLSTILALLAFCCALAAADACNPLTTTNCPAIPGLATTSYSIDFTKQTKLPDGWILADYANVTFDSNGARFWFNQRGSAPYIWTNFYIAYGRVDVDLMVANGTGVISSAVLFSDDQDEIDWEFSGSNFAHTDGQAYTNYFGKGITGNYDRASLQGVSTPQRTFHTYSFDWTPTTLTWLVDGSARHTLTNNGQNSGDHQFPQTPSRLHLGVWDAGDPNTAAGTVNWAGGYTDYSGCPYVATIKSVKITTSYPCSSWQYPTGFSGRWSDVKCTNQTLSTTSTTASTPTTATASKSTATSYTVASGDTAYAIAQDLGCTLTALYAANPGVSWDALNIGQPLNVPSALSSASSSTNTIQVVNLSRTGSSTVSNTTSPVAMTSTMSISTTTSSAVRNASSSMAGTSSSAMSTSMQPSANNRSTYVASWDNLGSQTSTGGSLTKSWSMILRTSSTTAAISTVTTDNGSGSTGSTSTPLTSSTSSVMSIASTSPTTPASTVVSSSTASSSTTAKLTCTYDSCVNSMLDARYSQSAQSFCSVYTAPQTTRTNSISPSYLSGCTQMPSRVNSACSCMTVLTSSQASSNTAVSSTTATPRTSSASTSAGWSGWNGGQAWSGKTGSSHTNNKGSGSGWAGWKRDGKADTVRGHRMKNIWGFAGRRIGAGGHA